MAQTRVRWGLGDAVAGFVVGVVAVNILAGIWIAVSGADLQALSTAAVGELGLWVGLLGAPVMATRRKGTGSLRADFGLRLERRDVLVGLVAGWASWTLVIPAVFRVQEWIIGKHDLDKAVHEVTDRAHGAAFVVLVLVVTVGAPIVEELFFRGLVLRSLERRVGTAWAVALSAVVFGLSHIGFETLQLAGLVALGIVLGVLAVRTGRLGPSMFAHAGFNGLTMLAVFLRR